MGYFWEDDDELNPKQRAMQSVLESDFVPQTPAAYSPMTRAPAQSFMGGMGSTPILPAINLARSMARPTSLDSPPSGGYSPAPAAAPGVNALGGIMGMAAGMQAGDRPYLQNGPVPTEQQPVGRVWTEADLEPVSVGSFGGFNFAKAARPYAYDNPNLPLFRADMAQRSQAMNFAAEMAANANRQAFAAEEAELQRQFQREQGDQRYGGIKARDLKTINEIPPGPLRDTAIDNLPDLSEEEKIDLKYGDILKSDKLTQYNLKGLLPFVGNTSDLAGLAGALEAKRGIKLAPRLANLEGAGNPWYARPVVGSVTPGSDWHKNLQAGFNAANLSPEDFAEYNLLRKMEQAVAAAAARQAVRR